MQYCDTQGLLSEQRIHRVTFKMNEMRELLNVSVFFVFCNLIQAFWARAYEPISWIKEMLKYCLYGNKRPSNTRCSYVKSFWFLLLRFNITHWIEIISDQFRNILHVMCRERERVWLPLWLLSGLFYAYSIAYSTVYDVSQRFRRQIKLIFAWIRRCTCHTQITCV